jgi:hypothetical protein
VTSVARLRERTATSAAMALRRVMESIAAAMTESGAPPRLMAVVTTPMPSGFDSTSASPARSAALVSTRSGATSPTTARPYFGSGSVTVCPPAMTNPAADATACAPSSTAASIAGSRSTSFQQTRLSASSGRPPIAYTSDTALVAATRPQS